ncbi:MAG: NAD-dependent epimerase/dehydratase family protein [Solirubrobacteraceae bacterium]
MRATGAGLLALGLERENVYGELFNIGSAEEVTIMELARRVREMCGSSSEIVTIPCEEAYERGFEDMARRVPDTGKIERAIGWKPTRSLDEILLDVVHQQHALA